MTAKWTAEAVAHNPMFLELKALVQAELDRLSASFEDRGPALQADLAACTQRIQGRSLSLADPSLSPALRQRLQTDLQTDLDNQTALDAQVRRAEADRTRGHHTVTAAEVADRLNRLAEVLGSGDPARANIELALHVEGIRGFADGRVQIRTCKLGALGGDWSDLIERGDGDSAPNGTSPSGVKARRLSKRRVVEADDSGQIDDEAEFATDPDRFASLDPRWFSVDETAIPPAQECWSSANALAVGMKRRETGGTHEQLAEFFGISVPTIRKALARAVTLDPSLTDLPRKMPRARWPEQNYREVVEQRRSGKTLEELCRHFGKSEPLIREALKLAERQNGPSTRESNSEATFA